jgi:hypothetical protein
MAMKSLFHIAGLLALILVFAIPGTAFAQDGQPNDQIVLGDNYTLSSGESVGNLTVFGGNVVLEAGSTVTDHLIVFGGNVTVNGTVNEDIHMYGGQLTLDDNAVVGGDISLTGGNLTQADGAQIAGTVSRSTSLPLGISIPNSSVVNVPRYIPDYGPIVGEGFWFIMKTLGLTALAMLVILFAPKAIERAGDAAMARPLASVGVGLLVAILTPVLLIGFAITIIGIPITFLLAVAAGILLTFGWIALGLEVGKRLEQTFHQTWPAVVSAGFGTLLLSLVANGIGLAPCVGWVVPTLVGFVGMGGVLISRFGTPGNSSPIPLVSAA